MKSWLPASVVDLAGSWLHLLLLGFYLYIRLFNIWSLHLAWCHDIAGISDDDLPFWHLLWIIILQRQNSCFSLIFLSIFEEASHMCCQFLKQTQELCNKPSGHENHTNCSKQELMQRDNKPFTGLPVFITLTFHWLMCCHKGFQDIITGEHGLLWQLKTI